MESADGNPGQPTSLAPGQDVGHETSRHGRTFDDTHLSHETSRHDLKTEETHLSRKKHDLHSIRSLKCIDDGSGDSGSAKDMSQDVGRPGRARLKPERLVDVYGQSLVKGKDSIQGVVVGSQRQGQQTLSPGPSDSLLYTHEVYSKSIPRARSLLVRATRPLVNMTAWLKLNCAPEYREDSCGAAGQAKGLA